MARAVSLYDLDGTILPWDTQKLFCHYVLQKHPLRRFFLPIYFALLPFYFVLGSEGLKRVFLSFLWGLKTEEVDELAKGFAQKWFPEKCYPAMLEQIENDRKNGHLLLLVSASPQLYVRHVAALLGFDYVYATEVEDCAKFPLFPDLTNNKGWEKVARLRRELPSELFSADGTLLDAVGYTDSTADLPMLTLCQRATVINPNKLLFAEAEKNHWEILTFPRPWRNSVCRTWQRLRYISGV